MSYPSVSSRLKSRRIELGISLRELARRTGLSAAFLSQVEHYKTNLSLDSLRRISEALDVSLLFFLNENSLEPTNGSDKQACGCHPEDLDTEGFTPVVRARCRPRLTLPQSGVSYELLVNELNRNMEAMCGRLAPGTSNVARKLRVPTEEFIYVLSGTLLVQIVGKEYTLCRGDSIYFAGQELQKLMCASLEEDAVWISVITPPVF
jgi:transcriptional regulator with XRE-family HTH domain/quercetin dioxygenase-like cupin family protein